MAVLLGGQHTSNVTGAWLMMHLLNEPKWLKMVMDEQEAVIGKDFKGQATFDQVSRVAPHVFFLIRVKLD